MSCFIEYFLVFLVLFLWLVGALGGRLMFLICSVVILWNVCSFVVCLISVLCMVGFLWIALRIMCLRLFLCCSRLVVVLVLIFFVFGSLLDGLLCSVMKFGICVGVML